MILILEKKIIRNEFPCMSALSYFADNLFLLWKLAENKHHIDNFQ